MDGDVGRESITIKFLDQVELSDDFFKPESHGGLDRLQIDFGSDGIQN